MNEDTESLLSEEVSDIAQAGMAESNEEDITFAQEPTARDSADRFESDNEEMEIDQDLT